MKLATRLGLAFLALVVLTAAVAAFALSRLSVVNDRTVEIATNSVPSIQVLGELRTTANQIRRNEADLLIAVDANEVGTISNGMAELKLVMAEKLARYERLLANDAERAAYAELRQLHGTYFGVQERLLPLVRAGGVEESRALFRGESRTAFNNMAAQIGKLVEINDKAAAALAADAQATYNTAMTWTFALTGAALVLAAALAWLILRSVSRQLGGDPAEAAALAQRVAEGDLSVPIAVQPGDTSSLLAALRRMQENLSQVVSNARRNAESVATASAQISQGNTDLSSRTEEQASALQQTAASMKELATTVQQNADNAQQGNRLALNATEVAARGGEVVRQVVDTMKGINDSSRQIADIIGVIDGIAFQTNILALNAAVEAARAGEQGRGFAVVASEVRNLAQRSADAAKEIKNLIQASVDRVEHGSALVDQAGSTMNEVVEAIRRVTELVGEISSASTQQSASVAQVGEAVHQMDQVTQQNAALVEESAAAAGSLKQQAGQLLDAVAVFKLAQGSPGFGSAAASAAAAANVVRPNFGQPQRRAPEAAAANAPVARTGTDDWTSF